MGLSKPRRDPNKRAEAFEALLFPELVDRIFHHAPYDLLLVLRATCKGWQYKADCRIVREVVLDYRDSSCISNKLTWKPATPYGPIPRPNWRTTKIANHVKHLDVNIPRYPAWMKKLDSLYTMRRKFAMNGSVKTLRPSAPYKVLQTGKPASGANHLVVSVGVTTVAVDTGQPLPDAKSSLPQSLTIILLGLPTKRSAATNPVPNEHGGMIFRTLVDVLGRHLDVAKKQSMSSPITVVNRPAWSAHLVYDSVERRGISFSATPNPHLQVFGSDFVFRLIVHYTASSARRPGGLHQLPLPRRVS